MCIMIRKMVNVSRYREACSVRIYSLTFSEVAPMFTVLTNDHVIKLIVRPPFLANRLLPSVLLHPSHLDLIHWDLLDRKVCDHRHRRHRHQCCSDQVPMELVVEVRYLVVVVLVVVHLVELLKMKMWKVDSVEARILGYTAIACH